MIAVLFWVAVGTIVYTYLGFPLLVLLRGALRPRRVASAPVIAITSASAAPTARKSRSVQLDDLLRGNALTFAIAPHRARV